LVISEEHAQALVTSPTVTSVAAKPEPGDTIEAQRDAYRRMLNFSIGNPLAAQQFYLSQYGYSYVQVSFTSPSMATAMCR